MKDIAGAIDRSPLSKRLCTAYFSLVVLYGSDTEHLLGQ